MVQRRDHARGSTYCYGWSDSFRNAKANVLNKTIAFMWSLALYHIMVCVVYAETWCKLAKLAYENDT